MEPVNLLPWRQMRRRRRARRLLLLLGAQLLLTPMLMTALGLHWRRQRLILEARLAPRQRQIVLDGTQRQRQLAKQRRLMALGQRQRQLDAVNQRFFILFRQLPALLPPRLWLTHIAQRDGRLSISGCSEGYPPIARLHRRLATHPLLPGLRWRELRRQDKGKWLFAMESAWPPHGER